MWKRKTLWLSSLGALVALGCTEDQGPAQRASLSAQTDVASDAGVGDAGAPTDDEVLLDAVRALDDAQLLYVADVANAGEVEEARAAWPKLSLELTREFADDMIEDHGDARDALLTFSDANDLFMAPSDVSWVLNRQGERAARRLLLAPEPVDRLYIHGQVLAHERALALFTALEEAADAAALQALFAAQRTTIEEHLGEVRELAATELPESDAGVPDAGADGGGGAETP